MDGQGAAWYVFMLLLELNTEITKIITKITKRTKPKQLSGADTKQKTTTHKTHVGKSYLSMVLNQRQR